MVPLLVLVLTQPPSEAPRPVLQGVDDVSPLQQSLSLEPVDLRQPSGFDRVYRLPTRPNFFGRVRESAFFRASGGLVAVFPQSSYRTVGRGVDIAEVPAGTVYQLGPIESGSAPLSGEDRRAFALVAAPSLSAAAPPSDPTPLPPGKLERPVFTIGSIFVSDAQRVHRVAELLEWAAARGEPVR